MEEQNSGKATLEEMTRLRVQLEQSSSESQSERQEFEALVQKLRSENARLERELRLIEQGRRNREPVEDLESQGHENDRIQGNGKIRADTQIGHKVKLSNSQNIRKLSPSMAESHKIRMVACSNQKFKFLQILSTMKKLS